MDNAAEALVSPGARRAATDALPYAIWGLVAGGVPSYHQLVLLVAVDAFAPRPTGALCSNWWMPAGRIESAIGQIPTPAARATTIWSTEGAPSTPVSVR